MLAAGERLTGIQLRGIDPEQELQATGLANSMLSGSLTDLEPRGSRIILGEALARELRVKLQDTVVLVVPKGSVTPVGIQPRTQALHGGRHLPLRHVRI